MKKCVVKYSNLPLKLLLLMALALPLVGCTNGELVDTKKMPGHMQDKLDGTMGTTSHRTHSGVYVIKDNTVTNVTDRDFNTSRYNKRIEPQDVFFDAEKSSVKY